MAPSAKPNLKNRNPCAACKLSRTKCIFTAAVKKCGRCSTKKIKCVVEGPQRHPKVKKEEDIEIDLAGCVNKAADGEGFQWINSFAKEFRESSEDNERKEIRNERAAIENNRPDYAPVLSNEGATSATTTAVPQLQPTPPGPPPPFSVQNYTTFQDDQPPPRYPGTIAPVAPVAQHPLPQQYNTNIIYSSMDMNLVARRPINSVPVANPNVRYHPYSYPTSISNPRSILLVGQPQRNIPMQPRQAIPQRRMMMLLTYQNGYMHAMYTTSDGNLNITSNADSTTAIVQMIQGVRTMNSSLATTQDDLQQLQGALISALAPRQ